MCQLQGSGNSAGICKLMCFWEKCFSKHPECLAGEDGCWSVSTCLKGCKSQESIQLLGFESQDQCKTHCLMSGTVNAQWHYLALAECIHGECGTDPDGACLKQTLEEALTQQEGACVAEVDECEKH